MIKLFGQVEIIIEDETLEVVRWGQTIYQDGKPVNRAKETFQITCNVQPIIGRDLLLVPEGDRYKENYWVFMNQKDTPLLINDIVIRPGVTQNNIATLVNFQTQEIQNWGSFTQARIVRLDVGPNANP